MLFGVKKESIPLALKPFLAVAERPKAEALGYLEESARTEAPVGMTTKGQRRGFGGVTGKRQPQIPFGDDKQKRTEAASGEGLDFHR